MLLKSAEEHTSFPFTVHCELVTCSHLAARSVTCTPWPGCNFPALPVYCGREKTSFDGQLAMSTQRKEFHMTTVK